MQETMKAERSFGLLFAVVFSVIALGPLVKGHDARLWALPVAAVFLAAAYVAPAALRPLNAAWMAFARILERVMNPLIMGVLFYLLFTPMGLMMRLAGRDPLNRRLLPQAKTYWLPRTAERRRPGAQMKFQF